MTDHRIGTREEWMAARLDLLEAEKELTRRSDELARQRQELPWVRIDNEYRFEADKGAASLADLFRGRSQLLVYHFMFGPDYPAGCPSCSAIPDGFNGSVVHLLNHDVSFYAVSRAPLERLQAYNHRMGWSFPWASSLHSDFKYDLHVSHTGREWESGDVEYNFRELDFRPPAGKEAFPERLERVDLRNRLGDLPPRRARHERLRAQDGVVYHTYSAYERGFDALWGMYQWLDPRAARAQTSQASATAATTSTTSRPATTTRRDYDHS